MADLPHLTQLTPSPDKTISSGCRIVRLSQLQSVIFRLRILCYISETAEVAPSTVLEEIGLRSASLQPGTSTHYSAHHKVEGM